MKKFREGNPIEAYKTLVNHFPLKQIRAMLNKHDPGPAPGTILFSVLNMQKKTSLRQDEPAPEKMGLAPAEEGGKPGQAVSKNDRNMILFRDVYSLARIIEDHQRGIEKQIKRVEASKATAATERGSKRAQSAHPTKVRMCPLGEHCPDFPKNKWPVSNQKGVRQIGEECPFAHHPFHINSKGFQKSNLKLKDKLIKKLKEELVNPSAASAGQKHNFWNPAGNKLSVSARYFNIKDARAAYNAINKQRLQDFTKEAEKHNMRLKNSKHVKEKMKIMQKKDDNYRQKMGYLNRAKVLYEKRRFKEAFETIVKAIAIVKKEDDEYLERHNQMKKKLKKDLDLSFGNRLINCRC
jgi:DNA-binding transcriptional MerR regulator